MNESCFVGWVDDADDADDDDADDALKSPQPPYKSGPNPPLQKSDFFTVAPPALRPDISCKWGNGSTEYF